MGEATSFPWGPRALVIALVLVSLAALPYAPFLSLPHISDDYLQIDLGRTYGPVSGWSALSGDILYRSRATSLVLTYWTDLLFGPASSIFLMESVLLHAMNTLLLAALGAWSSIGWRISVLAAGFFAFYEGHQEAVVWYAALPELLVFFFALLTLHAWLRWQRGGRWAWYLAALACFMLALLSKESAVVLVPLMAGAAVLDGRPALRVVPEVLPLAAAGAVYSWAIFTDPGHLHLNDGTFKANLGFVEVLLRSSWRLLWIWGLAALAAMAWLGRYRFRVLMTVGAWVAVTLLPYAFLTYMPYVPSRHSYWASAGLAFLVGTALAEVWRRPDWGPNRAAAAAAVMLVHNCGYLWIKKFPQYERRAAPTERLLEYASHLPGPITIKCFPYGDDVARLAMKIRAGREVRFDPAAASTAPGVYCDTDHP